MIKPKPPSPLANDAALIEYRKAQSKYIKKMFDAVFSESKAKTITDVLIYLCETYHPDFKIKKKRGAKTKWNPFLKAILAVDLDVRKKKHKQAKAAIIDLYEDECWSGMFIGNNSPFELVKLIANEGKSSSYFRFAKHLYMSSQSKIPGFIKNWDLFIKEEVYAALKEK